MIDLHTFPRATPLSSCIIEALLTIIAFYLSPSPLVYIIHTITHLQIKEAISARNYPFKGIRVWMKAQNICFQHI